MPASKRPTARRCPVTTAGLVGSGRRPGLGRPCAAPAVPAPYTPRTSHRTSTCAARSRRAPNGRPAAVRHPAYGGPRPALRRRTSVAGGLRPRALATWLCPSPHPLVEGSELAPFTTAAELLVFP